MNGSAKKSSTKWTSNEKSKHLKVKKLQKYTDKSNRLQSKRALIFYVKNVKYILSWTYIQAQKHSFERQS